MTTPAPCSRFASRARTTSLIDSSSRAANRFVQQQERAPGQERTGQRQAIALPFAHVESPIEELGEIERLETIPGFRIRDLVVLAAEQEVLPHGSPRKDKAAAQRRRTAPPALRTPLPVSHSSPPAQTSPLAANATPPGAREWWTFRSRRGPSGRPLPRL